MSYDDPKKDVFAHFGAAVYFAHCVETSMQHIVFAFEFRASANPNWTKQEYEQEFDRFDESCRALTFGSLRNRVRPFIPDDLFVALDAAKKKRDWLAHGYWYDRAGEMMVDGGEDFLIAELETIRQEFAQLDERLVAIYLPRWEKFGITEAATAEAERELLAMAGTRVGQRDA